mmetsp:Transcript_49402/g.122766  ORF Transcript_49402/g.122766 Transcript_49402/m.122766 type:complete len:226 (-) Transcript_49402:198-875(-)
MLARAVTRRGHAAFPRALAVLPSRLCSTTTEPPHPVAPRDRPRVERLFTPQWMPSVGHKYMAPSKWLGAYYTLREDNEVARRKRDRLCDKKSNVRGRYIMRTLDEMQIKQIQAAEPWRDWHFKQGHYIEVEHRASLSDPIHRVAGLVIGRHNQGMATSFRLLCDVEGVSVEYKFKLYSPLLLSITVRNRLDKRPKKRGNLFYMRDRGATISLPSNKHFEKGNRKR